MVKAYFEEKLFSACLDAEKKQMILKALDTQLNMITETKCSEGMIQKYRWLKEEVGKIGICTK